jgi:anti-sigma factor RsiW
MKTPVSAPGAMDDLSCREFVELATDYVEDRLPLDARSRFEMHICYCAPCKVYLRQIRSTIESAGRLTEDDLPPGPRETLLAAFRDWKKTV